MNSRLEEENNYLLQEDLPKLHCLKIKLEEGTLPFITAQLSLPFEQGIKTPILKDSGCSLSLITTTYLESLPGYNKELITKTPPMETIIAVGKTSINVEGYIFLHLIFDYKDKQFVYPQKFYIISELFYPIFLGNDFQISPYRIMETPYSILLNPDRIPPKQLLSLTKAIYRQRFPRAFQIPIQYYNTPPRTHNDIKYKHPNISSNTVVHITSMEIEPTTIRPQKRTDDIFTAMLHEDRFKTPAEKMEDIKSYNEQGFYQRSLSHVIDNGNTVQEMDFRQDHVKLTSEEEILKEIKVQHLSTENQKKVLTLARKYIKIFAKSSLDVGRTPILTATVDEIPKSPLYSQKYQSLPLGVQDEVEKVLDQFTKAGILEFYTGNPKFVQNILITRKRSGKIRLLLDSRCVNCVTEKRVCNLASQEDLIRTLVGKTHLSCLDISNAYFSIGLDEKSKAYFCFYDNNRILRTFAVLPQGYKNSTFFLERLMSQLFSSISGTTIYMDDLFFGTSGTFDEHLQGIEKIFKQIIVGNLRISPQKLFIASPTIDFLGLVISSKKICIPTAKLLAFKQYPSPTNKRQLRSLLGCLSFYRTFVPLYSKHTSILTPLASTTSKFKWEKEHETAFRTLIQAILDSAIRYTPDPNLPYECYTDSSDRSVGCTINQRDQKTDVLNLIVASSRTLNTTEAVYSIPKKEAASIIYMLTAFEFYLRFAKSIIVYSDARSLLFIKYAKSASPLLARFALLIAAHNITLRHTPGRENKAADALSRIVLPGNITAPDRSITTLTEKESLEIVNKLKLDKNLEFTPKEIAFMLQSESPKCQREKPETKKSFAGKTTLTQETLKPVKKIPRVSPLPRNAYEIKYRPKNIKAAAFFLHLFPKIDLPPTIPEEDTFTQENKHPLPHLVKHNALAFHIAALTTRKNDSETPNPSDEVERRIDNQPDSNTPTPVQQRQTRSSTQPTPGTSRGTEGTQPTPPKTSQPLPHDESNTDTSDEEQETGTNDELPQQEESNEEEESDEEAAEDEIERAPEDPNTLSEQIIIHAALRSGTLTLKEFRQGQQLDPEIREIYKELKSANTTEEVSEKYKLVKDIVVKKTHSTPRPNIYLPYCLLKYCFYMHHFTTYGAHQSAAKIKEALSSVFYRPHLKQDIAKLQGKCFHCITAIPPTLLHHTFGPTYMPDKPRVGYTIDLGFGYPETEQGTTGFLLILDLFSMYCCIVPLKETRTPDIITALEKAILIPHGPFKYLRSDRDPRFKADAFQTFCQKHGIEHNMTARHMPTSNTIAERHIQKVKAAIRVTISQLQDDSWDEHIIDIIYSLNHAPFTRIPANANLPLNTTPELLQYGYQTPTYFTFIQFDTWPEDIDEFAKALMDKAQKIHNAWKTHKQRTRQQNLQKRNQSRTTRNFKIGQRVWARIAEIKDASAITARYEGPMIVRDIANQTAAVECERTGNIKKVHFTHLIPYTNIEEENTHTDFPDRIRNLVT
jgi:hypothetical protein